MDKKEFVISGIFSFYILVFWLLILINDSRVNDLIVDGYFIKPIFENCKKIVSTGCIKGITYFIYEWSSSDILYIEDNFGRSCTKQIKKYVVFFFFFLIAH